jgi:stage II sporulation protein AA (anti-sigma F factor antagonist)
MELEIKTRTVGEILVVDMIGNLNTGTSGDASSELAKFTKEKCNVLINLDALGFLSSAGIRVLLRVAKQLNAAGGAMKVCCAKGVVKEVLEISGLTNVLGLCDSESAALEAF